MSGTSIKQPPNLAGSKRRSLSGQGGLLNRMFGTSPGAGKGVGETSVENATTNGVAQPPAVNITTIGESNQDVHTAMRSPSRNKPDDQGDKKRRSSGVGRARDLFSSAKQHMSNFGSSPESRSTDRIPQTQMQKLGKHDPALSVPQGSLNNSAGESVPGPRSTFRVGVTEDKNKKCRRTMEDTHAYLYNFLSTPNPSFTTSDAVSSRHRGSLAESTKSSLLSQVSTQEVIETDNGYFAIFDGHAGTFAADWCGKKVHLLLEDIIRKNPNTPIPELLDMTFTAVDQQLERLPLKNSGCTAVTAVLRWEDRIPNNTSATGSTAVAPAVAEKVAKSAPTEGHDTPPDVVQTVEQEVRKEASRQRVLYTANVGDARIVLCRNGKALRLSYDHKGSDENEGKRIASAGGLILNNRVNGVLAVTRALGDAYMKDLVTGHPYTTETVIQGDIDEFMILACDGLWDVCSDQEAVDLIRNTQDPQQASKMLVDHALARFSTDNLSCMVVRFDGKAVQQTINNLTEPIGVDGDPATIKGGISEAEAIVLQTRKQIDQAGGENVAPIAVDVVEHENKANEPKAMEPTPQLNPEALQAARKDTETTEHTEETPQVAQAVQDTTATS